MIGIQGLKKQTKTGQKANTAHHNICCCLSSFNTYCFQFQQIGPRSLQQLYWDYLNGLLLCDKIQKICTPQFVFPWEKYAYQRLPTATYECVILVIISSNWWCICHLLLLGGNNVNQVLVVCNNNISLLFCQRVKVQRGSSKE